MGNFRIVSRRVVENFNQMREHLRFFGGLVDWMGYPSATIEVAHAERHSGKSTYTLRKLLKLASESIIAYSDKPLWLAVSIGFAIAAFAFLFGLGVIAKAVFFGSPVTGWASLIVSLYFLGGIIIGILGILGIYLGKTYQETKRRPLYIVKEAHNVV
ncbi:hypothetical protein D3C78_1480380 [compost metagenome]